LIALHSACAILSAIPEGFFGDRAGRLVHNVIGEMGQLQ
jgi:hypothetical protein